MWYVAAWSHELGPETPISRTIINEPIVLYRQSDSRVVALEDRCPHRHAPLSLGRIEGDQLRCMYHGLKFDSAGSCVQVPRNNAASLRIRARSFPVLERSSWIWVWLGDPAKAKAEEVPHAFGLDDPEWTMSPGALDYAANYQLVNDNLCDLSHLDFVHEQTLGAATGTSWSREEPTIQTLDNGLLIQRWFFDHLLTPNGPQRVDTFNSYHYLLPGIFLMKTLAFEPGVASASGFDVSPEKALFERVEQQAVTPISDERTRYHFATGVRAKYASPQFMEKMAGVVNAAFDEDRRMIEGQQRIWNMTPAGRRKAFIPQDKAPATFRQMIAKRCALEVPVTADAPAV